VKLCDLLCCCAVCLQLKATQAAAAAAAASSPAAGSAAGMEELHAQVVRLKRQRDRLTRDQQELSRALNEAQEAAALARQEAAAAKVWFGDAEVLAVVVECLTEACVWSLNMVFETVTDSRMRDDVQEHAQHLLPEPTSTLSVGCMCCRISMQLWVPMPGR
jgi:hypothetical protein